MSQPQTKYGRGSEAFRALIRFIMADVVYHISWGAKVVAQDDDGTLQVQPTSPLMPGMKGVPMRLGVPGMTAKVKPDSTCIITFEDGDPKKPIATGWNLADLDSVSMTVGDTFNLNAKTVNLTPNGLQIARNGDMTSMGGPAMIPVPCTLILTTPIVVPSTPPATIPPGTPIVCTFQLMTPGYGNIVSGNPSILG